MNLIEKLTLELEKCYISENIPTQTATRLATKAGIKALANGVKNPETKMLLKAGNFDTLTSAIGKATENEGGTSSIFNFKKTNNYRGNNRNNFGNGHHQGRGGHRYRHNYKGKNRGGHNFRGGYQQNHRGGYQNSRGNHHQDNRVFFEQTENHPLPQHQTRQNAGGIEETNQRRQIQIQNVTH